LPRRAGNFNYQVARRVARLFVAVKEVFVQQPETRWDAGLVEDDWPGKCRCGTCSAFALLAAAGRRQRLAKRGRRLVDLHEEAKRARQLGAVSKDEYYKALTFEWEIANRLQGEEAEG
jgi:hypothetical protein